MLLKIKTLYSIIILVVFYIQNLMSFQPESEIADLKCNKIIGNENLFLFIFLKADYSNKIKVMIYYRESTLKYYEN